MRWPTRSRWPAASTVGVLLVSGCASFNPIPIDEVGFKDRAVTKRDGDVRVSVAVPTAEEAEQIFGAENLDPWCVEEMRKTAKEMDGTHSGPFPRHVRAEIYAHYIDEVKRISPQTPTNLCTEERAMWDILADHLEMDPDKMFCCCGQFSPPRMQAV